MIRRLIGCAVIALGLGRGAVLARSHDLASIKSILQNATADL